MIHYLLAAEADKIQDLIFRSSRLREVVGGSQLLSGFCTQGASALLQLLGTPQDRIIVNDGGSFRVRLSDENDELARQRAETFGRDLAELYRRCTGGNLTVATPVGYADHSQFKQANDLAQRNLRHAKHRGPGRDLTAAAVHLPYIAFCASCGMALASNHDKRHDDQRPDYVCSDCQHKFAEARGSEKNNPGKSEFLESFRAAIWKAIQQDLQDRPQAGRIAKHPLKFARQGDWAKALAQFDARRYVAYLKADGNGMGTIFSACRNEDQLHELSEALPIVLRASLAAPTRLLLDRVKELRTAPKEVLPVLPLILGGDDLFALLPAPWVLDYAARFCQSYEARLKEALDGIGLQVDHQPTVSATVVICKANYPYTLAHERCESLLEDAKRCARFIAFSADKPPASVLNFAVITGNDVDGLEAVSTAKRRGTLQPYLVGANAGVDNPDRLPLENVLKHRLQLKSLPGKRRAELKQQYDDDTLLGKEQEWWQDLNDLLERIQVSTGLRDKVEQALTDLGGDSQDGYWRSVQRPGRGENGFLGNGLPDLLTTWEWSLRLDKPRSSYED